MVSFLWGNSPKNFPSDSGRIESEMLEYIQEENDEFISYFNEGKRDIEEKGGDVSEYVSKFKELLTKITSEKKLIDIIVGHPDGKDAIENFTTSKLKNTRITDEKKVEYLEGLMLESLNDSNTVNRLRGFGALKFGQSFENLPDFDSDELMDELNIDAYTDKMVIDLTFKEVIPDDMDEYDSEMQPVRFSYGKDNIEFRFPIEDDILIQEKLKHLKEKTNQVPDFTPSKGKTYLPKVVIQMPITIPPSVIKELTKAAEVEVVDMIEGEDGELEEEGSPYVLEHSEFMKLGSAGMESRSETMQEDRIYNLGDKLVKLIKGNKDGAGKQVTVPDSTLDEIESKFYPILKKIEENLFLGALNNPLKVTTYSGIASFKTDVQYFNSLTEKVDKVISGDEAKIKSITIMVDGKAKQLTVKEAQEMESKAWTHKETKQKISNSTYIELDEVEKRNYSANYNIISVDGEERNPIGENATTYNKIKQYVLKDAPEDAYGEKTVELPVFRRSNPERKSDKPVLSEEEGKELRQSIEDTRQRFLSEEGKTEKQIRSDKDSADKLLSFEDRYDEGTASQYKGDYIDRAEYEKLKARVEQGEIFVRKRVISPKAYSRIGITTQGGDYKPEYVETDLPKDEKGNIIRTKQRERVVAQDYSIDGPDKFGVRRDRGLAVVTGEGKALNALVFYENIEKAFSQLNVRVELVFKSLGEFTLSPAQRRRNDSMVNVIEDVKENLLTLKEKIGE